MNNKSYLALEIPINNSRFNDLHDYLKSTLHLRDKQKGDKDFCNGTMSWQTRYHITLRFSDYSPSDRSIDKIKSELDSVLNDFQPIQLVFTRLGHFEGKGDNYPVYITCDAVPAELKVLQSKVNEILKKYDGGGYYDFSTHLTLGRIAKSCSREDLQAALDAFSKGNPFWIRLTAKDIKYHVTRKTADGHAKYECAYEKALDFSTDAKAVKKQKDEHDARIKAYVHRNEGKPIIYIDMDNTIVDLSSALYKLPQRMIDEAKDGEMDNIPGIYAIMDPIPNAIKSVRYLASKYDVYILSTSPWDNPTAWSDKLLWIKRYLGDELWKKLILSHNKHLNRGEFLIDDAEKNGAKEFGKISGQEHIKIFSDQFPDWNTVVEYIDKQVYP